MSGVVSRVASAAIVALVVSLSYLFIWKPIKDQQDYAWRALAYYKGQYDYYFNGANDRGLLDICEKNGELKALFKDECPPESHPLPGEGL